MPVISATDISTVQLSFSNQVRATSENELELNCESNEARCLVEACIGSECPALGKGLGISQLFSEELLSSNDLMNTNSKDNCQTSDEKDEISNFNFRASAEESEELDSNINLGKSNHTPLAWWDHSGSDILIGMDLGMIKKICSVDLRLNDNAEVENGFSVTISNGSKGFQKVVNEDTGGSVPSSWSTNDFANLTGRFIQLTIPGLSDFYVDNDDDDPVVSEIKIKALPLTQTSRNSTTMSTPADTLTRQVHNNSTAQLDLSPLEFLDSGSDLLDTPNPASEHFAINQGSLTDMSSTPTSNMYTGDIFLP
ncbi:MAG: hypothetical protein ACRD8Z_05520 [Nitrososphaeraceae archaeon]